MTHQSGLRRRGFLGLGTCLIASAIVPPWWSGNRPHASRQIPADDFVFDAFWGDDRIGSHVIRLRPLDGADGWRTEVEIDMKVDLGIFGDITFKHRCSEVWENGLLQSLTSETDDDGETFSVIGERRGDSISIEGPGGPSTAPGNLLTTNSAWSVDICRQDQVIDVTHGEVIGLVAEQDGAGSVDTGQGKVTADRYTVMSPLIAGELFYDHQGNWLGGTIQRSGENVQYVRVR